MNSIHNAQLDLNLLKTFDALFVTRCGEIEEGRVFRRTKHPQA
jgi:hypothetical protein